MGGRFTRIDGKSRRNLAAVDRTSGRVTAWNPSAKGWSVDALAVSGSTVYAGGEFARIGGKVRRYLAALDARTGHATDWNPKANSFVSDPRRRRFDASTLAAGSTASAARPAIPSPPRAEAAEPPPTGTRARTARSISLVVAGSTVYAGGSFTRVGGKARRYIAALDRDTGVATDWNPKANCRYSRCAVSGSTVYAGGVFTRIGGASRGHVAALDARSGARHRLEPEHERRASLRSPSRARPSMSAASS